MLYKRENVVLQKLFIWVYILSCPSNQQPRFLTLLVGAMLLSPTCMESMLTLASCCLIPMILNSVLSSFSLIQAGEQFSMEWQKSWLISIPLLSLVYDRESQYYLRMSIVKTLHINSELVITAFKANWSVFRRLKVTAPGLVYASAGIFFIIVFPQSDFWYITYIAFHPMLTLRHSVEIAPGKINI